MPKLTIDQRDVEVPPGTTVLAAARQLGIDIPALCYLEGCDPPTSCLVCVVKIDGSKRLAPACATLAEGGMRIESETTEVHAARRTALELLLSDHLGDCLAPCYFGCPARMDIPQMLRQIASGDLRGAIATVKRHIALPAILGRICPAPCEKACRRRGLDGPVAICLLKRYVADVDLASGDPYQPTPQPPSGKRVAIIGGGPTGLAAAYYLTQAGHDCILFESTRRLGGRLWTETTPEQLPRDVLQAEIEQITRLGVDIQLDRTIDSAKALTDLQWDSNAVLLACGASAKDSAAHWGLKSDPHGIQAAPDTFLTQRGGVFAAGHAVRSKGLVVRSVADGKEAALAIDQYLRGLPVTGPEKPFNTKIGKMEGDELQHFALAASSELLAAPARGVAHGYEQAEAVRQAARCMHCDCRGLSTCKLRKYAALYNANPKRFAGRRRKFQQDLQHADVVYEPGKCIDCGLCIQIAAAEGEKIGLAFVGRGFNVRVAVPLEGNLRDALQKAADRCVTACPTAALAWKRVGSESTVRRQ